MFFPDTLRPGLPALGIGLGVILLLLWLVVAVWAYRDMRRRSRTMGWAVTAFLLVLLLPIAGLIAYLLLRPPETLMEGYDRALDQELKLQQLESVQTCPGCSRIIQPDWIVCPDCHVTLQRPCAHCGTALDLNWQICPVCAHVVERPNGSPPEAVSFSG